MRKIFSLFNFSYWEEFKFNLPLKTNKHLLPPKKPVVKILRNPALDNHHLWCLYNKWHFILNITNFMITILFHIMKYSLSRLIL